MAQDTDPSRLNSSEAAYQQLRQQILDGTLKSGEALKERDLCSDLGISRTPVREALRRLSADGLVDISPRRSIRVTQLDPSELKEIYEVGSVLQTYVTGLAVVKSTKADIQSLTKLVDKMERLLAAGSEDLAAEYAQLDHAFHDRIAEIARNSRILQIIRQAVDVRLLANVMDRYEADDFRVSLEEHHVILAAIARKDQRAARAAIAKHVRHPELAEV